MFGETTADGLTQCVRRATDWYGKRCAWDALQRPRDAARFRVGTLGPALSRSL